MQEKDELIFSTLFRDAYTKCFGHPMTVPLSETESKLFATRLLDVTGLGIGWRSLKNYSIAILSSELEKKENPSVATLDTLARFVLSAPYTNEIARKNNEGHHPYWYQYRAAPALRIAPVKNKKYVFRPLYAAGLVALLLTAYFMGTRHYRQRPFIDSFSDLRDNGLQQRGWQLLHKNGEYWAKRGINPKMLTLFTLQGDNWPDSAITPEIDNLLYKEINSACYTAELQMENFIPIEEWQQAGLLLMEDTIPGTSSVRISLAFNDLFGGYKRPKEILVQAIALTSQMNKPEEFAHHVVVYPDSSIANKLLLNNLKHTAIRIIAHEKHYRFLFSGSDRNNGPFKEIVTKTLDFTPRYIGIFALKGNKQDASIIPVVFRHFSIIPESCQ